MTRFATALGLLGACSFGMQGVDPRWDGRSEPPDCSDGTIMFDRVAGSALVIAGASVIGPNQGNEASLAVGGVSIGLGLVYWLAALSGSKVYAACQMARMRWAYSNAIKARAPIRAPATPPPAPRPGGVAPPRPGPQDEAQPWAKGVPEKERSIAFELYEEGNREFIQGRYPQALVRYREAIQHWEHPAIRYNIAVCLINLGRPVEARNNLERGMAYGPEVLGADVYAQGEAYRTRLDAQLARLTLDCPEPGEEVMIDGQLVFTGPGVVATFLMPGEHNIVATKPGFLPATRKVVLVAGQSMSYEIRPFVDPRPAGP